jgi:transcriptional regulator with XRE-family HTH domain
LSTTFIDLFKKNYPQEIIVIRGMIQEHELRVLFSSNIKKFRNRRGWSQINLAEKLDISANFLSEIETGKGWVSPLTLAKLANALDIEVSELFEVNKEENPSTNNSEDEKMARFAKDMTLALDLSAKKAAIAFKKTIEDVYKGYFSES